MTRRRCWQRPLLTLVVVFAVCMWGLNATPTAAFQDAAEQVRLPQDTLAFVHLRVDTLLGSGPLAHVQQQLKADALAKLLQEPKHTLGVDLRDVEQLTLGVVFVGPPQVIAPYLHVRTQKPVDRKAVLATLHKAQEQEMAGLYARGDDMAEPWDAIRFFDDRSFARGPKTTLQHMQNTPPSNELRRRFADALACLNKHHLVAGLALTPETKKFLSSQLRQNSDQLEDSVLHRMAQMVLSLESGYLTFDLTPHPRWTAAMQFSDERQATRAMRFAHAAVWTMQTLMGMNLGTSNLREIPKLLDVFGEALDSTQIVQKGTQVSLNLEVKIPTDQLQRALLEAVLEAQRAATAALRQSNLRFLVIAMHNYHSDFNRMPGNLCDAQGKPILSWRVALLPYLEHEALYRQFKLDEPWDSPNNKPLLAQMPKYYQVPGAQTPPGQTHLQVFMAAPNYEGRFAPIFHFGPLNRQRTLGQITGMDGTSNTFCIVEATTPVIWTKPDDLMIDATIEDLTKPSPALGALPDDPFFAVVFADGSTRLLRRSLADTSKFKRILRAHIGVADGDPEDLSPLERDHDSSRKVFRTVGEKLEVPPPPDDPKPPKPQDP